MLIDTHCHLNHDDFGPDTPGCVSRAVESGVERMIVVGYDVASSVRAVNLAEQYAPWLFAAVAVHPHDARAWSPDTHDQIRDLADCSRVVAIGEIGLDYYREVAPRDAQLAAFRAQIELARRLSLPVIIHCRDAYAHTLDIVDQRHAAELGGVMHCWTGTQAEADRAITLGLALGFGGLVTFKNAPEVRACAAKAQDHALLLETDAPYLAPVPHRGRRNEPAYLAFVAEKLAELRGSTVPEIAALTTTNAERVFPVLAPARRAESARHNP